MLLCDFVLSYSKLPWTAIYCRVSCCPVIFCNIQLCAAIQHWSTSVQATNTAVLYICTVQISTSVQLRSVLCTTVQSLSQGCTDVVQIQAAGRMGGYVVIQAGGKGTDGSPSRHHLVMLASLPIKTCILASNLNYRIWNKQRGFIYISSRRRISAKKNDL